MKDFERYVKVTGSDNLHSILHTIAHTCGQIHDETEHLRSLEADKHRIYAEARTEGRSLLADLKQLNKHLGEPQAFTVARPAAAARKRVAKRTPARRAPTRKAAPKARPAKRTAARKAPARRPARKASPKPKARTKATAKRVAPKKSRDAENLKRLKANLDAIRASLK